MPTTLRYIGTQNPYFETAVTGKPTKWTPGDTSDVVDGDVTALVATGFFEVYADRVLPFAFNAAGNVAGVRMPNGAIQEIASESADDIRTFDINGAGTYILTLGAGSLLSILLTSAATASPGLTAYDNTSASGPLVLAATNITAGSNVAVPVGTPNVGSPFSTGLCLVVAGAQVGRVTVRLGS